MDEPVVKTQTRGAYRIVTLNRPQRLNAFNEAMHLALREALDDAAADKSCRAVCLTGAGRGFCTGQDLNDRVAAPGEHPDLGRSLEDFYNPLARQLRSLPVPVVAAVNGVAAGAGVSLAMNCDIVLAAHSASFAVSFAKVGLVPDSGGTWHLPRLVGPARARALALLGETVSAQMAADWGLIWKAVADDRVLSEAEAICLRLSEGSAPAHVAIKRALDAAARNDFETQLELERDLQRAAGFSPDYAEGVQAFMAKRPPSFSGRD